METDLLNLFENIELPNAMACIADWNVVRSGRFRWLRE